MSPGVSSPSLTPVDVDLRSCPGLGKDSGRVPTRSVRRREVCDSISVHVRILFSHL